ncbi:MAG: hypothetical protein WCV91_02380 [Candidatus Margulisiibacteriota bacterium]
MGQEYDRHFEDFRQPSKHEKGGIIKLSGAFLLDHEQEILNLIENENQKAIAENPEHKVIKVEKANSGIMVEVSEHSLAMHIGKSLSSAFKGKHEYKFRPGEKFVEVDWQRD